VSIGCFRNRGKIEFMVDISSTYARRSSGEYNMSGVGWDKCNLKYSLYLFCSVVVPME
jgi:hypothetical protein